MKIKALFGFDSLDKILKYNASISMDMLIIMHVKLN
jgi:hypothetical protein